MGTDSFDVKKWVFRAYDDIESAVILAEYRRPKIEVACYLCQQAVEKILKAYILAQGSARKKIHALKDLLDECEGYSSGFHSFEDACLELTHYVASGRYPSVIDPTEHDMRKAIKDARQILGFTMSKLKELGYEYNPEQAENHTP